MNRLFLALPLAAAVSACGSADEPPTDLEAARSDGEAQAFAARAHLKDVRLVRPDDADDEGAAESQGEDEGTGAIPLNSVADHTNDTHRVED